VVCQRFNTLAVTCASSAREAIGVLESTNPDAFQLILTVCPTSAMPGYASDNSCAHYGQDPALQHTYLCIHQAAAHISQVIPACCDRESNTLALCSAYPADAFVIVLFTCACSADHTPMDTTALANFMHTCISIEAQIWSRDLNRHS
jgi:hypothetical protein